MGTQPWHWDDTLYAGSARHYSRGRMPYPAAVADALRAELALDGTGRLLDVGCGPGSLTLLLAPLFRAVVGVDADGDMLAEARRRADDHTVTTIRWVRLRAEHLPAGLGAFRVATFAQSFHWMDQPAVARRVRGMLTGDGAWVHVGATTHRGAAGPRHLAHPRPPWDRIHELVQSYLGPTRRAGRGTLPDGTRAGEEDVMRQAGFAGPTRIEVGGGRVAQRSTDEIVSAVFSLSSAAPHLFAGRRAEFEADLRQLLHAASADGQFAETTEDVALVIWRPDPRSGAGAAS